MITPLQRFEREKNELRKRQLDLIEKDRKKKLGKKQYQTKLHRQKIKRGLQKKKIKQQLRGDSEYSMPSKFGYGYAPFTEQEEIHNALRPMCGGLIAMAITGRRFGKTTVAVNEVIDHAVEIPGSRIWYVAHTERQAYRIAWNLMIEPRLDKQNNILPPYLPGDLIKKKREDLHTLRLYNGTLIEFLGTIRELPMLGAGLHLVVFDEFPAIPWTIWYDIVRPMLLDFKGNTLLIGTVPDPIANVITPQFIEMYEDALYKRSGKKKMGFNFSSYCNPHIDKEALEEQIEDLERKGKKSDAKRLYEGKYTREYGLVFPKFDYHKHTCEPFPIPNSWIRLMAIDPHPQKPDCSLWCAVDPRNHFWFYREKEFVYAERRMTIPEEAYHITMMENEAKEKIHKRVMDPTYGKVEETAKGVESVKKIFASNSLHFAEASRTFEPFYYKVIDMLVDIPEPTFHIFRTCPNFIRQMENYMWDPWGTAKARSEKGAKNRPKKLDDDFVDCAKYIINANVRYPNVASLAAYDARLKDRWERKAFL